MLPMTESERPAEPLGLTVYAMPSPEAAVAQDARRTRLGRWKMLLVALICAAPVAASYFTYFVVRPTGQSSYGTLIDPQRPMPSLAAEDLHAHQRTDLSRLKGQWLLVSVAGGACDARCESNLYLQRQLHESLGKDKDRVDWVWLVDDQQPLREALLPALKYATVLRVPQAELARWLAPEAGHALHEHLYLIDPMGNWMLRFPPDMDTAGALQAKPVLLRLLRAASSWDMAGRE